MKHSMMLLALCAAVSLSAQTPLRLHGSTTVTAALLPHQAEIEQRTGAKLELRALGSASGLLALDSGLADVAMISTPLDEVARRVNEKSPGTIHEADFHVAPVGTVKIAFIVNPRNTVRHLSAVQLAAIFTGKITNWRELGGVDLPILVVTLANASPLVEEKLLGGSKITAKARQVPTANQIPPVVAEEPGAIGIVSAAHARGKTSLVTTDAEIVTPLFLVTKGEPTAAARKVIDAARAALVEKTS